MRASLFGTLAGGGAAPVTPINYIGSVAASCGGASNVATTGPLDTTGSLLLVAALSWYPGGGGLDGNGITDSAGNTWQSLTSYETPGHIGAVAFRYCLSPTTDAVQTFQVGGTTCYPAIAVIAFGNVNGPNYGDVGAGVDSATTQQPGALTPSANGAVLVTGLSFNDTTLAGNATINGGFTVAQSKSDSLGLAVAIAYQIQTTAALVNPTWTSPSAAGRIAASMTSFLPV